MSGRDDSDDMAEECHIVDGRLFISILVLCLLQSSHTPASAARKTISLNCHISHERKLPPFESTGIGVTVDMNNTLGAAIKDHITELWTHSEIRRLVY